VVEVMVSWEQFDDLAAVARAHPVVLVLGHAGLPVERSTEYQANWRAGLERVAAVPTAVCKISALGGADPSWTIASLRPWVLGCIDAFGPRRCMFASNWPVDKLFATYDGLLSAYAEIVADFSEAERAALFSETAERVYRI
jgi:predicted TIM-barrel fold metal-dependent hydrolase